MDIKKVIQDAKASYAKNKELRSLKKKVAPKKKSTVKKKSKNKISFMKRVKIRATLYKAWAQKNTSVLVKSALVGIAAVTVAGVMPDQIPLLGPLSNTISEQIANKEVSALVGSGMTLLFLMGSMSKGLTRVTYSDLSETTKAKLTEYGYTRNQLEIVEEGLELFTNTDISRDETVFDALLEPEVEGESTFKGAIRATKELVDITFSPIVEKDPVVVEEVEETEESTNSVRTTRRGRR